MQMLKNFFFLNCKRKHGQINERERRGEEEEEEGGGGRVSRTALGKL